MGLKEAAGPGGLGLGAASGTLVGVLCAVSGALRTADLASGVASPVASAAFAATVLGSVGAVLGLLLALAARALKGNRRRKARLAKGSPMLLAGLMVLLLALVRLIGLYSVAQPIGAAVIGLAAILVSHLILTTAAGSAGDDGRDALAAGGGFVAAVAAGIAFFALTSPTSSAQLASNTQKLGLIAGYVAAGAATVLIFRAATALLQLLADRLGRQRALLYVFLPLGLAVAVLGVFGKDHGDAMTAKLAQLPASHSGIDAPSIIMISVDTLRPDFLGYNDGPARTPNLNSLAERSTVFDTARSVAPWTRSSFAACFTGIYPSEVGQARYLGAEGHRTQSIPYTWANDHPTLAELLQQAGYFTAAIATNVHLTDGSGASRGFDFFHHCSLHEAAQGPTLARPRSLLAPKGATWHELNDLERADRVTELALRLIRAADERPMLLWAHYMDPHQPYDPPTIPPEARVRPETEMGMANMLAQSAVEREQWIDAYTAEVDYVDQWIGKLLDGLRAEGLLDNAIVVFWSDHGEEFWEHGGWDHGHTLYDEVIRVPLMIHMPGQDRTRRVDQPVSLLDLMPTLLRAAEVDGPEELRGRALQPAMAGEDLGEFRCWLEACCYGSIRKGLVTDRYKLIHDTYKRTFELYDLVEDPGERRNLFGSPRAPATAQMQAELRSWTDAGLDRMEEYVGRGDSGEIDPATREALRDMGYIQ
jgi:arylsulfatase A-like enzyme